MKTISKWLSIFVIFNFIFLLSIPVYAQTDFDLNHVDASDDVEYMEGNDLHQVSGQPNIDILEVESYKKPISQVIILEMTVTGKIIAAENISYMFTIMDGDSESYMVMFQNGSCNGISMDSMDIEPDELKCEGENTDTLIVEIPLKKVAFISEFDIIGSSMRFDDSDEEFKIYMDYCPDQDFPWINGDEEETIIVIEEPLNRSMICNTCKIKGITIEYYEPIESVEIQIDSQSATGWDTASSSDQWFTWEFEWDTTPVSEGKHTIYARAYDGENYYFDEIIVNVNQSIVTNPISTQVPVFRIGDKYQYEMNDYMEYDYVANFIISSEMTIEIIVLDTVTVNGSDYDVYIIEITGFYEENSEDYYVKSNIDGELWLHRKNLAIIREEIETRSTMQDTEGTNHAITHDIITYDPPSNKYNFPLKVGAQWTEEISETTQSTFTIDGETNKETYHETIINNYQCIGKESITVPAGTFETFIIYSVQEYDDSWDDDDWEFEDSDGDGWADDDEEYFGTDPEDPEDYPEFEEFGDNETIIIESNGDSGNGYDDEYIYEEEYYSFSSDGYTLEYFSEETGFLVKMESYDEQRQLISSTELVSYNYHGGAGNSYTNGGSDDPLSYSMDIPIEILFIFILVVIILIFLILLIRRKKRKHEQMIVSEYEIIDENIDKKSETKFEVVEEEQRKNIEK